LTVNTVHARSVSHPPELAHERFLCGNERLDRIGTERDGSRGRSWSSARGGEVLAAAVTIMVGSMTAAPGWVIVTSQSGDLFGDL
jgi:hypothetical protein